MSSSEVYSPIASSLLETEEEILLVSYIYMATIYPLIK